MTTKEIRDEIASLHAKVRAENDRHTRKRLKLERQLDDIRKECSHPKVTYQNDHCRFSDGTMECTVCGKTAKHL